MKNKEEQKLKIEEQMTMKIVPMGDILSMNNHKILVDLYDMWKNCNSKMKR